MLSKIVNGIEVVLTAEEESIVNSTWANNADTLEKAKARRIEYINQEADKAFAQILAGYPAKEPETWPNQYAEAWALQSDPAAYTPTLTNIAIEYGVPVSVIAQKVLEKAAASTVATGRIIGKRKKLTDQVNACTTNAQTETIVW